MPIIVKRSSFETVAALAWQRAEFSSSARPIVTYVTTLCALSVGLSCSPPPKVDAKRSPSTNSEARISSAGTFGGPALQPPTGSQPNTQNENVRRASDLKLTDLRAQLAKDPKNTAKRVELAALLSVRGQDSDAEDVLREALQGGQHTAEIYHALGMIYLHNNQYIPATKAFSVETALHPRDFDAHLKLATAYAYVSRVDDANREFLAAKAINPSVPDTYLGLAYLNNSSERYPYAVKFLNEFIKRSKQPGPGYALLSRIYLNMQLYEQAVTAGKTASAMMPDNAATWYTLGQAYSYRPGEQFLADGANAFEQTVKLSPGWGKAHFELGHIYTRQHRPADAIAQYREAVRTEPDRGKNYYQLGQLLMQQGQTEEGKKQLQKAQELIAVNQREDQLQQKIAATPNNPKNLFELAQLYKKIGSYEKAQVWYQDTLILSPNYPHAREELLEVRKLMNMAPK